MIAVKATRKKGPTAARFERWIVRYEKRLLKNLAEHMVDAVKDSMGAPGPNPPSLPGNPPNRQTSLLYQGVTYDLATDGHVAWVISKREGTGEVPAYLEFGTRNMAERPYMRPGYALTRDRFRQIAEKTYKEVPLR